MTPAVVIGDSVQQAAAGKAARGDLPRSRQAELGAFARDPLEILARQDESRVAELVPIRYGRMLASQFAFFRGAAAVMAADLAQTPATGFSTQLCSDAHLSNFGVFSAPDRRLVFDCNDFDETCPGPFEWDVKRLVASIAVAGRERGFGAGQRRKSIARAAAAYRESIRRFAEMRNIDVWYARIDVDSRLAELRSQVDGRRRRDVERNLEKARSKDSLRALRKLTREVDGKVRIVSDPPLITPLAELTDAADAEAQMQVLLGAYRESLADAFDRAMVEFAEAYADRNEGDFAQLKEAVAKGKIVAETDLR